MELTEKALGLVALLFEVRASVLVAPLAYTMVQLQQGRLDEQSRFCPYVANISVSRNLTVEGIMTC
jgi:hypothetical protein